MYYTFALLLLEKSLIQVEYPTIQYLMNDGECWEWKTIPFLEKIQSSIYHGSIENNQMAPYCWRRTNRNHQKCLVVRKSLIYVQTIRICTYLHSILYFIQYFLPLNWIVYHIEKICLPNCKYNKTKYTKRVFSIK